MAGIFIKPATDELDKVDARTLMLEYAAHLRTTALAVEKIHLDAMEREAAGLPAPYLAPGAILLARVDGEAAGCVALKPMGSDSLSLELKRLWVRSEFRGLGLGRKLMEAAIGHAQAAGADAVYLDTVPAAMPEANRLYEALGFERIDRYNDNPVTDVIFYRLGLK